MRQLVPGLGEQQRAPPRRVRPVPLPAPQPGEATAAPAAALCYLAREVPLQ